MCAHIAEFHSVPDISTVSQDLHDHIHHPQLVTRSLTRQVVSPVDLRLRIADPSYTLERTESSLTSFKLGCVKGLLPAPGTW